ncbi:MAG: hypothetical protein HZB10_00835 [Candidatus Yonathbacteria bacterium]|nr:hypothetical protein [Candidatus Yonathbacteria bacterium]
MNKIFSLFRSWRQSIRGIMSHLRVRRVQTKSIHSDTTLVARLTKRRFPTLQQWKYLPRYLSTTERVGFILLVLLMIGSLGAVATRFYLRTTIVVPARGGSYTEALVGAPRFVNPIIAQTNDVDLDLTRLIFAGLFRHTETLRLEPDLVERFTVSEDQKTYTLILKDGLRFDDGEPLTTRDVAFTITTIQDPEWRSPLEPTLRGVIADAIDERTIELKLHEPFAPFLDNLTFGILPEHIWADIPPTNAAFADENLKPIGSGLYRVESYVKNTNGITQYTLVRNPYSHRTPPLLDRVIFRFFPDAMTAFEAVKNKQVDGVSSVPPQLFASLEREQRRLGIYTVSTPQYTTLFFKSASGAALGDAKTRTALARAIDRLQILETVFVRRGEIVSSMIPKGTPGYNPNLDPITFDREAAKTLLKEAGWKELAKEGYGALWEKQERERREKAKENAATPTPLLPPPALEQYWDRNGTILTMEVTTIDNPDLVATATIIKQAWEAIGVPTNIVRVEQAQWTKEVLQPRHYTALLTNILVGADPNPYPLWHSSQIEYPGYNLAQFQNQDLDKLLEETRKSLSVDERMTRYKKIQEILRREMPAFPLVNQWYTYAIDRNVRGVTEDRILIPADRFATIANWYVNTKRIWK